MFSVNTAGSRAHVASVDNQCFGDVDRCNDRISRNVGIGFHCAGNLRNVRRCTARTVGELANFVRYYREAAAGTLRYRLDCCGSWRIRQLSEKAPAIRLGFTVKQA
jgi:hypothetical protein